MISVRTSSLCTTCARSVHSPEMCMPHMLASCMPAHPHTPALMVRIAGARKVRASARGRLSDGCSGELEPHGGQGTDGQDRHHLVAYSQAQQPFEPGASALQSSAYHTSIYCLVSATRCAQVADKRIVVRECEKLGKRKRAASGMPAVRYSLAMAPPPPPPRFSDTPSKLGGGAESQ